MSQGRGWMGAYLVQFPLDRSFAGKAGTWEALCCHHCSPQPCPKRSEFLEGLVVPTLGTQG